MDGAGVFEDTWQMNRGESLSTRIQDAEPVSGIYMLHFADGERYIGQAVDVVRRYATHCRTYDDIVAVSFRRVPVPDLDEAEKASIAAFEHTVPLRNKQLTGRPGGVTVLDLVVPPAQRLAWAAGDRAEPRDTPRHVDLDHAPSRGYQTLRARPDYPQLLDVLGAFLRIAICWPRTTEQRFWTITALPNTAPGNGWRRLVTVSANNLEILVISEHRDGEVGGFLNTAHLHPQGWWARRRLARVAPHREPRRSPVGGDIDRIDFDSYPELHRLLRHPPIAQAAGQLATALMLKGPSMFSRFHCVHLASDLLDPPDQHHDRPGSSIDIRGTAPNPPTPVHPRSTA